MTTKNIKGRIQHKHDTEANWQLAINFIPMIGELIVYDPDSNHSEPRLKIGDGQTLVNDLPFTAVSLSDLTTILDDYAKIANVPTKVSQLENDSNFSKIEGITSTEDKITIDRPVVFEGSTITSGTKATIGGRGDSSTGYHSEYAITEEDLEYKTNNGFYLTSIIGGGFTFYEDEACTTEVSTIFVAAGGSTPIYIPSGPDTSWPVYIELEGSYGTIYFKDGNGESFSFKFAKITPETNIPSDITDLKFRVSSLESNSGGSSNIGGAYYVCAPLVNAQYYSPNPNWFLALPPQDSCSKIVLKSIRYVYQPKNNQPYTYNLNLNATLYDKNSSITYWSGNIDYLMGSSDGSGAEISVSISFSYYGNEFGCYDTNTGDNNDNYACLKTSYFVFEITP